jgi:hypothetical protein
MINVLDKLFKKGLIANYIDRFNDFESPEDFIEFWGGICKYFAYYVIYARKYQNFHEDKYLLTEYLEERGLKTAEDNTLPQLQEMMKKYNREISRRGTKHIIDHTGVNGNIFDGEILRLINFHNGDEFLYNQNKSEHAGWNIGKSSPMYRSVTIHDNFNKYYEKGIEPQDLSKYPLQGIVTIPTDVTIGKKVLNIAANSGIGNNSNFKITVDPYMDYEFSFFIKKSDGNNLTVGFDAYDKDGNPVDLQSRIDGSTLNNYFVNKNLQRSDKYIYCRFFLYNKLKPLYAYDGVNLRMVNDVVYVVPKILMGTGTATVYNIRLLPMALPYSKGFVQVNNFIDALVRNNNNKFSIQDVDQYMRKYLIPYSSQLKLIETNRGVGDYSLETYIPPTPLPVAPTVTTAVPSGVAPHQATLGGNVTSDGGASVTEKGIVWNTTGNPTIADNKIAMGAGTGSFSDLITGLLTGQIYIKAYAINSVGISYGNEETAILPVGIVSISIVNVNPSNASLITWEVEFSDAVSGVTIAAFALAITGGITGASISALYAPVGGTGTNWTVEVNTGTGDGTIGLNFVDDSAVSLPISNEPFTGAVYLIDKSAPTVSILTHPSLSSNTDTPSFTFNGSDIGGSGLAGFLIKLDGGGFTPFTGTGLTYTTLSQGKPYIPNQSIR